MTIGGWICLGLLVAALVFVWSLCAMSSQISREEEKHELPRKYRK